MEQGTCILRPQPAADKQAARRDGLIKMLRYFMRGIQDNGFAIREMGMQGTHQIHLNNGIQCTYDKSTLQLAFSRNF
ncbi:hypothetical protein [Sulfitobacter sp. JB4-11]|uniref:hypothetical protein n=1 Tax=Sulfitobacter rhodophyticola TaxID=3238304 RepID=UPI003516A021